MDWAFLVIAFFADFVGTIAGFGSSTIALPLSLFMYPFETALVLVAFLHIFGNLGRIGFFRHGIDRRLIAQFGVPSVLLSFVGALLVSWVPPDILKMVLGAFLVGYMFFAWSGKLTVKPSLSASILGGSVSGFFAGLIGTGGALRAAFLTAFNLPKEKYIATAAAIAFAVDLTRLPLYLAQRFFPEELYSTLPALLGVALFGTYLGKLVVGKIPQEIFRRIVLVFLGFIGALFLARSISSLLL
ncbi:sulfonate transporter [Candidatus Kaiserbacteria bacterium RIFCSPHIGHO2_02_FULL_50_50]|uniref:Probable membrane transporter protein n=1 Tax=Candidatus Kaiserbacteria bacterium RIFCSPHIGHO2_02_FULL_50_50 TaxID=1798492 RepID=A0A1F6DE04_9BACT|nr:MAG: sulfonate transporter [Candidatus Kaiserbacteria bacterium RIFCSPHIGHO2_02_FULL_50_50]OGG88727.1 MAG: sulfonate transporter [Candidatus Kaiserbacteria bacterium RIFCSPLOWO2_12_FULL_50_10]